MKKKLTKAQHRKRHLELHRALDELVADWIAHGWGHYPSKATILELMTWSCEQVVDPTDILKTKTS